MLVPALGLAVALVVGLAAASPQTREFADRAARGDKGALDALVELVRKEKSADAEYELWAAAGFVDILLRCPMKLEVGHGYEKAVRPGVQA